MRLRKDLVSRFVHDWPYDTAVPCVYCGVPIDRDALSNAADQGCLSPDGDHMGWFCPLCAGFWVRWARPRSDARGQRVFKLTRTLRFDDDGATGV